MSNLAIMRKEHQTFLQELSKQIPLITYTATEKVIMNGEDAQLCQTTIEDTQKFDPEKMYTVSMPVIRDMKHYRRIKRAFKRHGGEGVLHYLKSLGVSKEKIAQINKMIKSLP